MKLQTVDFLFILEIFKKALKLTSQLFIFRAFFGPPILNLKKFPVNQLIKTSWPKFVQIFNDLDCSLILLLM